MDESESDPVFDLNLYKNILNTDLCKDQIKYMVMNNTFLLLRFLDSSMRIPRNVLGYNDRDLGNYYQCLDINESYEGLRIAGKYCLIHLPLFQDYNHLPGYSSHKKLEDINLINLGPVQKWILVKYYTFLKFLRRCSFPRSSYDIESSFVSRVFKLAACIPQVCSVTEALNAIFSNVSSNGPSYYEAYCRLPNDKPWVTADSVALVTFLVIGILTIMSSTYELLFIFVLRRAEYEANVYYRLFSVYNNTRLLCKCSQSQDHIKCLDGIKVLSIMLVLISHSISYSSYFYNVNGVAMINWARSILNAMTSPQIVVDTFFITTAILLVYSTVKKMDERKLLKSLHLFYMNRLVRILPLLATAVIFEMSIFHRIADGPDWVQVARSAEICRKYWWYTLLQLQNYITPLEMCVKQSWYISLDLQLHFLSPLLLYWLVNGRSANARTAIVVSIVGAMVVSSIYCVRLELPSDPFAINRSHETTRYRKLYYFRLISRGPPFLVGMAVGYVLHIWRGKSVKINKILVVFLWLMTLATYMLFLYAGYCVKQMDWDNHTMDTIVNILMRPTWALAIGWIVIACVHGYGGPINWFLALPVWQLPNKLTYGIYLFHYQIIGVAHGTALAPTYFSLASIVRAHLRSISAASAEIRSGEEYLCIFWKLHLGSFVTNILFVCFLFVNILFISGLVLIIASLRIWAFVALVSLLYQCLAYMVMSFALSFVLTVLIDIPITVLFKQLVEGGAVEANRRKRLQRIEAYELELAIN